MPGCLRHGNDATATLSMTRVHRWVERIATREVDVYSAVQAILDS